MPARQVSDDQLIERLTGLFRRHGFDASSLQEIASASGLQKSSLYHRFPGGKEQMAVEVVAAVERRFADDILAPLLAIDRDAPVRALRDAVAQVTDRLAHFYGGGRTACLLETLGVGSAGAETRRALASTATGWIAVFGDIARRAGATDDEATAAAEDALASIEGALVVARVTGSTASFDRALERLPHLMTSFGPSLARPTERPTGRTAGPTIGPTIDPDPDPDPTGAN